jgi:hypothetical protein
VRRSERVPAKKAKEAQLEAARLAKELAAAAELEQQVEADLEANASQGAVLDQEEEPAAEAVQTEVPVGSEWSEPVSKRLVSIRVMQMQAAVLYSAQNGRMVYQTATGCERYNWRSRGVAQQRPWQQSFITHPSRLWRSLRRKG